MCDDPAYVLICTTCDSCWLKQVRPAVHFHVANDVLSFQKLQPLTSAANVALRAGTFLESGDCGSGWFVSERAASFGTGAGAHAEGSSGRSHLGELSGGFSQRCQAAGQRSPVLGWD